MFIFSESLKIKRVYDRPETGDGRRILIDRLWPRGLAKDDVKIDLWLKEIAPGSDLRKWFSHDERKWTEFRKRYFTELDSKPELVDIIINSARHEIVTLLYAAKDLKFNNAVALKEYIEAKQAEG